MQFTQVLPIFALLLHIFAVANGNSTNGIVSGAVSCGGSSALINMEFTNCTQSPCDVESEISYEIGITFFSAETTSTVKWMVYIYFPNGGVRLLSDKIAAGSIVGGEAYTVSDNVIVPVRFEALDCELSVMLMNGETNSRIACGIFPVKVAPV